MTSLIFPPSIFTAWKCLPSKAKIYYMLRLLCNIVKTWQLAFKIKKFYELEIRLVMKNCASRRVRSITGLLLFTCVPRRARAIARLKRPGLTERIQVLWNRETVEPYVSVGYITGFAYKRNFSSKCEFVFISDYLLFGW